MPPSGTMVDPVQPTVSQNRSWDWKGKVLQIRWELGEVKVSGSIARIHEVTDRMTHSQHLMMIWETTDTSEVTVLFQRLTRWRQHAHGNLCPIHELFLEEGRICAVLGCSAGHAASLANPVTDSELSLRGRILKESLMQAHSSLLEGEWSLKRIWIDREEPLWLPDALEPVACSIPVPAETPVEKAAVGCAYALYSLALGKEPGFGAIPFVQLRPSVDRSVSDWCDGMFFAHMLAISDKNRVKLNKGTKCPS